jgi:hypothetical protein
VQVPPPANGLEQSHATAGQSAFAGHATGRTQVQPPPEASGTWQYPPATQVSPAGQRSIDDDSGRCPDQAQPLTASHAARSPNDAHGSGVTQTPVGHAVPAGQSAAIARHSQFSTVAHSSALGILPQASLTTAAGTACVSECV